MESRPDPLARAVAAAPWCRPLGFARGALPIAPPVEERKLLELYDEFERWLDDGAHARRDARRSAWSRAEHVEHVLAANREILERVRGLLEAPRTARPPGAGPSLAGWLVLVAGRIPRGRGAAPARLCPSGAVEPSMQRAALAAARAQLARTLDSFARAGRSPARAAHALFGDLDAAQWIRYARIHADHHARIARALR